MSFILGRKDYVSGTNTSVDPTFVDAIPNQQKQGLMKTLMSYVGIKGQENAIPTVSSHVPSNYDNSNNSYISPPSVYNQPSSGTTSGIHYMPARDLQNRKAA